MATCTKITMKATKDAFQILEVNLWTRAPNLADIGTFVVPILMYVLLKTHIKWVPCTSLKKNTVRRLYYIKIYIMIE